MRRGLIRSELVCCLLSPLSACGGAAEECLQVDVDCTPQYTPSFDAIYDNTLSTSCALSGCHAGSSGQGGLSLGEGADDAYQALSPYVTPGDPGCSLLVDHIEPEGLGDMPPGSPLAEEERCAVRLWIHEGASR